MIVNILESQLSKEEFQNHEIFKKYKTFWSQFKSQVGFYRVDYRGHKKCQKDFYQLHIYLLMSFKVPSFNSFSLSSNVFLYHDFSDFN